MPTYQYISHDPSDLHEIAGKLLEKYQDQNVFAFYGQMGSGKTTFVRALCDILQVKDNVSSPTFAIINEYSSIDGFPVYHFDFYRIKRPAEALDIGSEEYFYSGEYCFIEWPELVEELLPDNCIRVEIAMGKMDNERIFTF